MASGSWVLTAAAWCSILAGVLVTLCGLILIGVLFLGKGVPVGGAGLFQILTMGAGPVLALAGPAVVYAAIRLMGGYGWARSALEIFFWMVAAATVLYIAYNTSRLRGIEASNVVRGTIFFALTGAPALALALLLRSASVVRAMVR